MPRRLAIYWYMYVESGLALVRRGWTRGSSSIGFVVHPTVIPKVPRIFIEQGIFLLCSASLTAAPIIL